MLSAPIGCSSPCLFRKLLEEARVKRLDELRFLRGALAVAVVLEGDEGDAGRLQGRMGAGVEEEALVLVGGLGGEAAVVDGLGDEAADVRVHAVGGGEEDAAPGGDGGEAVEEEVERRLAGAAGVDALDRLAELRLVAEEHEVLRRGAGGDEVDERHLAGLVDEEVVERMFQGRVDEVLARLQAVLSTRKRRLQILERSEEHTPELQ